MSVTHTVPFAANRAERGFFRNAADYLMFLAASFSVARSWAAHMPADERALERAGMTRMQDQVLALRY